MATSVYPNMGGAVDNTSAAKFIPEIWSDEVIAAYKSNLVLANLVKKMSMTGKKGDTIHVPKPTRGSAHAKVAETAVTIQNSVESEVLININKHFEFSRLIEDITEVQALASLRQFYTGDAGYGLAKQVDNDRLNWLSLSAMATVLATLTLVLSRLTLPLVLWKPMTLTVLLTLALSLTLRSVVSFKRWMTQTFLWAVVASSYHLHCVTLSWVLIATLLLTLLMAKA